MNVALIDPSISPIMAARDRVRAMERENPLIAFLLFAEAIGDGRIHCDVTAHAQLGAVREAAREAWKRHTGRPFTTNDLYPE